LDCFAADDRAIRAIYGGRLALIDSPMDGVVDDFTAGFVFSNPNAKGSCGCGESFTV
jgi:iron-sulfur cluster assembly protein